MAYATLQDLIDRYGQDELTALTDRSATGSPDATVAGVALTDASQVIDGYLAGRYQLPLATVPPLVIRWACDIARFYLWKDQASDAVKALYMAAIASLQQVQRGAMTLEALAVETAQSDNLVVVDGPGRRFTADGLGGF